MVASKFNTFDESLFSRLPMAMLTSLPLTKREWKQIAMGASWQTTRMNLNTFDRHGVLADAEVASVVAARLRNRELIKRARAFPYQLMVAYQMASGVPRKIREAIQDAMEIATGNIPALEGRVWVLPDVSGSMHSPLTGYRKGSTTAVRCVDVAALISACILRVNESAEVIPFSHELHKVDINSRDTIMTNATKLASLAAGGTNCSLPLAKLNADRAVGDYVIYVSDNESWIDKETSFGTATMREWEAFKSRNPNAKLICIDLQPGNTTQASDRRDILNVGGFSDQVFTTMSEFFKGEYSAGHWVRQIEKVAV